MNKSNLDLIKHSIFNHSIIEKNDFSFRTHDFDLGQLRSEFFSLHKLFLSNKNSWVLFPEIALYISDVSNLLIAYYEYDYASSELAKFKRMRNEIETLIQDHLLKSDPEVVVKFPGFLIRRIKQNIYEHQEAINNLSLLRKKVGTINSRRSRFTYSRAVAINIIAYLKNNSIGELIHEINIMLGNQFSFEEGLYFLENSRVAIAIIGIVLFAFRFMINLIIMLKHIVHALNHSNLSKSKIFKQELEKRGFAMASDLVWASVTLLTTFNNFFNIANGTIPPLILSFLIFDALLLIIELLVTYLKYSQQMQKLVQQKNATTPLAESIIQRQIDLLNDEWFAQYAYYEINILGAIIIASSFAISMFLTAGFAMALLSMLGNALYNTAGEYKKYCQAKIAWKRENTNGLILNDEEHRHLKHILEREYIAAYTSFWKELALNAGGIAFIITAAVASWPIALGLTLSYTGYQLFKGYQKQNDRKNQKVEPHNIYRFLNAPGERPHGHEDDFNYNAITLSQGSEL